VEEPREITMTPELAAQCNGFLVWFIPVLVVLWVAGVRLVVWLERND
jgi:hypothetical protein